MIDEKKGGARMEKVPMTQPGFTALEIELKRRQSEDRHRIVAAISAFCV